MPPPASSTAAGTLRATGALHSKSRGRARKTSPPISRTQAPAPTPPATNTRRAAAELSRARTIARASRMASGASSGRMYRGCLPMDIV